jgi:glycerol kinase
MVTSLTSAGLMLSTLFFSKSPMSWLISNCHSCRENERR